MTKEEFEQTATAALNEAITRIKMNNKVFINLVRYKIVKARDNSDWHNYGEWHIVFELEYPKQSFPQTFAIGVNYFDGTRSPENLYCLTDLMSRNAGYKQKSLLPEDSFRVLCIAGGLFAFGIRYHYI